MLCRSRAVCMGYLHSEQKTRDTIDDEGWLHSGDLVRADQEGFYKVVGRIKEIIIPAGGENVAPTNIEDEIKLALPSLVSNVMVVGDGRQYLTCLITLKAGLVSSISNVTGAVSQVEVDLQTQKPSQILEQQTRDWVKSGGISHETAMMG